MFAIFVFTLAPLRQEHRGSASKIQAVIVSAYRDAFFSQRESTKIKGTGIIVLESVFRYGWTSSS